VYNIHGAGRAAARAKAREESPGCTGQEAG
jgi:hypothetical protein